MFSNRLWPKLSIFFIVATVLYIEFICYWILPYQWENTPKCVNPRCQKMLLVADPQILGTQTYNKGLLHKISIWDSDKYLKNTFLQALEYVKPNVVVFLGDIMDEGHIALDNEFFRDLKRFQNIFQHNLEIQDIIIPGDNDIGGDEDIMLPNIVHRFNRVFNQSQGPIILDNLEFYKVNFLTFSYQEPYYNSEGDEEIVRIILSHMPLLTRAGPFIKLVVKKIKPHLIFSGHDHKSVHVNTLYADDIWKREMQPVLPSQSATRVYKLSSQKIHEIIVPTCSYRMGTSDMGYGAAFVDTKTHTLSYNVLWLPDRFTHLYLYLTLLIIIVSLLVLFLCSLLFVKLVRFIHFLYACSYHRVTSKCSNSV